VILVVTHSGFARSLLLAVQREPYRPQNAELIPVIVEQTRKKGSSNADDQDLNDDEDSWIDAVLDRHAEQLQGSGGIQQEQGADMVAQKKSPCFMRRFFAWAVQTMHNARQ
jgi:hypothetical protein